MLRGAAHGRNAEREPNHRGLGVDEILPLRLLKCAHRCLDGARVFLLQPFFLLVQRDGQFFCGLLMCGGQRFAMPALVFRPFAFKLDQTSFQPHVGHFCVLFREFVFAEQCWQLANE